MNTNPGSDLLAGKVALVTGAGRGVGRAIALGLAAAGPRVVVNDVGTSPSGEGTDLAPAREVVAAIKAQGGQAQADLHSVPDTDPAPATAKTALDAYGRIE